MAKVQLYAIIFLVIIAMTKVLAEESSALPEETPEVTANEVTLAAEAAASSFRSSAGEAAEGAKSWADWAANKIRHPGEILEKTPGSE